MDPWQLLGEALDAVDDARFFDDKYSDLYSRMERAIGKHRLELQQARTASASEPVLSAGAVEE
jgi:hypothetical protein